MVSLGASEEATNSLRGKYNDPKVSQPSTATNGLAPTISTNDCKKTVHSDAPNEQPEVTGLQGVQTVYHSPPNGEG